MLTSYKLACFRPINPAFFPLVNKRLCGFLSDNVHFHQAAEISEALVEEQVDFEAMVSRHKIKRLQHT